MLGIADLEFLAVTGSPDAEGRPHALVMRARGSTRQWEMRRRVLSRIAGQVRQRATDHETMSAPGRVPMPRHRSVPIGGRVMHENRTVG